MIEKKYGDNIPKVVSTHAVFYLSPEEKRAYMHLSFVENLSLGFMQLPQEEGHHLLKVLRSRVGDKLLLGDGQGNRAQAIVHTTDRRTVEVEVQKIDYVPKKAFGLTMAVAPTKSNDRMEWFLEKATEMGVDRVVPILCANSERKTIKQERFHKVLKAAMKQSQRWWLPDLAPLTPLADLLKEQQGCKFIAHCHEKERWPLEHALPIGEHVCILIGPEGDFSLDEVALAKQNEWKAVSLSDARLRTETAALAAVQIFHSVQHFGPQNQ